MNAAQTIGRFLDEATRFLFFTGKGGVGKTSLACATAVALAESGKRTLLVSTDPASNLDEVLGTKLSGDPTAVTGVAGLFALNIDPNAAARKYRERIVGPIRGALPEATVRSIEEQLSGACTTEIASFNEFSRLLGDPSSVAGYDHVILDTAPTGHTLRLLALPAAWSDFIAQNKTGSSCLGPLSGLAEQRHVYEQALAALRDASQTTLALVARADVASLREAARASQELAALGIRRQSLIVNAVFKPADTKDRLAAAMEQRALAALAAIPAALATLPRFELPFRADGLSGLDRLRSLLGGQEEIAAVPQDVATLEIESLDTIVERIAASGRGVVMTMGKGGVGKSTLAKRIARQLAAMGYRTRLTTTDPANHVGDVDISDTPLLSVSAIDPKETTRQHIESTLAVAGRSLDPEALALLEEELRSPCTEEIAVFTAFAHEVARGEEQFVVLDTAPTGHTLLLLDATEAYHREALKNAGALPDAVQRLLPRLRDPHFAKIVIVTLPEATPVHEAAQLQADLRRAEIEPYAWIVNQCIRAGDTDDPLLRAKAAREGPYLREVAELHATLWAAEPWTADEALPQLARE